MKADGYVLDTDICAFYLRARINRCAESLMLLLSLLLSISPFL